MTGVVLPWDHNAYYHHVLLRAVPAGTGEVLEVGCGAGLLASKLAVRARHVDALDRDSTMIDLARSRVPTNVECRVADVMTTDLTLGRYDAIVSMSALHHLALEPALTRLAGALRPGGVLAVIAVPRVDLPRELPVELAATTWHHLIGVALVAGGNRTSFGKQFTRAADHDVMPVASSALTTSEVRRRAASVLPGVRVRRLLLWRYLLFWRDSAVTSNPRE